MKRMLINANQPDEMRVVIVDNGQLVDLDVEYPEQDQKQSNIYRGVISSIEKSLGAVFVNYGSERHGFLPLKEISREYFRQPLPDNMNDADIYKLLKVGDEIVVQVDKEERGTKGAALTTFISLAGSYLVLMPNNPRAGGISRRIDNDDRDNLKEILSSLNVPETSGLIVRTAGVGRDKEELAWDLEMLLRYWEAIKKAALLKPGPYLIHKEDDVVIRAIRDYLRHDISEIILDDPKAFERAKNYIQQIRPDFADRVKLYTDKLPLFSRFLIEQQIENAYQHEIRLPSGGSIVIDHTEALVSIDINSARATKGSSIEETACNTNLEAADEIGRQLRVRDIGGLVVIDFIDMTQSKNQRSVEARLRDAVKNDRARIQVGRISRFGLLEMSRQRLGSSLNKTSRITCPRCDGIGTIRTVESLSLSIIHLLQEQAAKEDDNYVQVQVPIDVSTYLLNEKREQIEEIEKNSNITIQIIANQFLQTPHYSLKAFENDPMNTVPSYRQIKAPKTDNSTLKKAPVLKSQTEPAVNEFLSDTPPKSAPMPKKTANDGLVKRIWDKIFNPGKDATSAPKRPIKNNQNRTHTSNRNKNYNKPNSSGDAARKKKGAPANRSRSNNDRNRSEQRSTSGNRRNQRGNQNQARRGNRAGEKTRQTNKSDQSDIKKAPKQNHEHKEAKEKLIDDHKNTSENINQNIDTSTPVKADAAVKKQPENKPSTEAKSTEKHTNQSAPSSLDSSPSASLQQVQTSKGDGTKINARMEVQHKTGHVTISDDEKSTIDHPKGASMQQVTTKKSDNN